MMAAPPEKLVSDACEWVAAHPETWRNLVSLCLVLKRQGHRIQRDSVYTLAMQHGMAIGDAREFRRNHNLWSVLSRYMVMQHPSLAPCIELRATPVDDIDLEAAWHSIVGPCDFAARSPAEAMAMGCGL